MRTRLVCHPFSFPTERSLRSPVDTSLSLPRCIATQQGLEYAPSCAIVGGILGQDALNAIGGKEEPVRNFFVFEGETGQGRVWPLGV